ncbi:MAG: hypothetical protein AB1523_06360 [Bacillota bacterium]
MRELAAVAFLVSLAFFLSLSLWARNLFTTKSSIYLIALLSFICTVTYPYLATAVAYPEVILALLAIVAIFALAVNSWDTHAHKRAVRRQTHNHPEKESQTRPPGYLSFEEIATLASVIKEKFFAAEKYKNESSVAEDTLSPASETAKRDGHAPAAPGTPAAAHDPHGKTDRGEPPQGKAEEPATGRLSAPQPAKSLENIKQENENILRDCLKKGFALKENGQLANAAKCFLEAYKLTSSRKLRTGLLIEISQIYKETGQSDQAAAILKLLERVRDQQSGVEPARKAL